MNPWQRDVLAFSEATGGPIAGAPTMPTGELAELRAKLIAEEAAETIAALGFDVYVRLGQPDAIHRPFAEYPRRADPSLAGVVDGVADLIYVALGLLVNAGVDLEPFWNEVQRANMAKVGPGSRTREDGKVLKPAGWRPPDIEGLLRGHLPFAADPYAEADEPLTCCPYHVEGPVGNGAQSCGSAL